ncbi:MAG: DUF3857 domain-containing protein [Phycisphaerae bacterium]
MSGSTLRRCTGSLGSVLLAVVAMPAVVSCRTNTAFAQSTAARTADLSLGRAQFPDEDAAILRWEQSWTLEKDGTVRRRDHKWLKLFTRRPVRRYGDPRVAFVNGSDELIIHTARTILPDGTILPVPDYSFNVAGPDDVAGWPEYADWQDKIISFSGIENDAVLELDYEVVTPPEASPWMWGDIRLDDDYPVVARVITVTVPQSARLSYKLDRADDAIEALPEDSRDGMQSYQWTFKSLPGAPDEPQSLSWQRRCARLRFTTCGGVERWVEAFLDRADKAARPDERINKFAVDATKDAVGVAEQIQKLAKKLHDSFNVISSPKTLRSLRCRLAGDTFQSGYGNPLEAAAVYAAALRSLGIDTSLSVGVDRDLWDDTVPTESAFAGVVVSAEVPGGAPIHMHPQHGVFRNPGQWGRHWLLSLDDAGTLNQTRVYARGERQPGELSIAGKIAISSEGKATGELRLRMTGPFFDPDKLDTAEAQKKLVTKMVNSVLSAVDVPSNSIVTLSDEVFRATAEVATESTLRHYGDRYVLKLGDGPTFLAYVPLPLNQSSRRTAVNVSSRLNEQIDIVIELPEDWSVAIAPAGIGVVEGPWGRVSQTVELDGRRVRFRRSVAITTETIMPQAFNKLRNALNTLRAEHSLLVVAQSPS